MPPRAGKPGRTIEMYKVWAFRRKAGNPKNEFEVKQVV